MTSLAVIFVLLLVASLNNMQRKTQQTVNDILVSLKKELQQYAGQGVEVKTDPKDPLGLLVLVPEGLLQFEKNRSEIPSAGVAFLDDFAPRLVGTACDRRFREEISSIVIEGHADSSGDEERINLPLSQRRSMSVVTGILSALNGPPSANKQQDLTRCFLTFASASGRGSEDPVLADGKEDPERSRRVIFKIRVRSLEQRELLTRVSS
jgi:outer membrane protein OmpA-like peptidoglycan-associated protein